VIQEEVRDGRGGGFNERQTRVSAAHTEVGEDGFDDFGRRIGKVDIYIHICTCIDVRTYMFISVFMCKYVHKCAYPFSLTHNIIYLLIFFNIGHER
jgi:hypothetical protein